MSPAVIGIDLGTTYTCMGVIQDGKVEIVANNEGQRITPSVVAFIEPTEPDKEFEVLVGEPAKTESWISPENAITCAKRLIGRTFDDPTIKDDLRMWPFKVVDVQGKAKYQVEVNEKTRTIFPEEISAQVLMKMKVMAEDYLGEDVKEAVITVPAYFSENQKQATRNAAGIAGLVVLDLLSEPTAAAVAYGADLQAKAVRNVVVFDFGGGTFDVSVIQIDDCKLKVLSIDGDPHLGGEDIDNNLALYFEEMFNRRNNTQLRADNSRAWRRLKDQCEKLKIRLSKLMIGNLKIDALHGEKDLNGSLTRAKLEEINDELFRKAVLVMERAIEKSKLSKSDINDVLMVGGSTRIPKVRKLVTQALPHANMPDSLDTDEAVAVGATILAAQKTQTRLERYTHLKIWNVIPQPLGVGTGRGLMHTFIPSNTCVPVEETMILSTERDNQNLIRFKVFEGENTDTSKNYYLGEFRIAGIPPAPRGIPQIEVTFRVDEDCMLEVFARDLAMGRSKGLRIQYDHDRLSKEEIKELQIRAQSFASHNQEVRARLLALRDLEECAKVIRATCLGDRFRNIMPAGIHALIKETYEWVDQWHSKQEYPTVQNTGSMKKKLEDVWNPFITEVYKGNTRAEPPVILD